MPAEVVGIGFSELAVFRFTENIGKPERGNYYR